MTRLVHQIHVCWHDNKNASSSVVLNTDASFHDSGRAGIGGILREGEEGEKRGKFILAFYGLTNALSSSDAELQALHEGLREARRSGVRDMVVYLDNSGVVDFVNKKQVNHKKFGATIKAITTLINKRNWRVKVEHDYRETNAVADHFSKKGASQKKKLVLLRTEPKDIKSMLEKDASRTAYYRK